MWVWCCVPGSQWWPGIPISIYSHPELGVPLEPQWLYTSYGGGYGKYPPFTFISSFNCCHISRSLHWLWLLTSSSWHLTSNITDGCHALTFSHQNWCWSIKSHSLGPSGMEYIVISCTFSQEFQELSFVMWNASMHTS